MAADASPLLLPDSEPLTVDDAVERCIGDFGKSQFLHAFLVCCACIFDAQQTFISSLADSHPSWHCISFPCSPSTFSPCTLPPHSWAWDSPTSSSTISNWNLICSSSLVAGLPASLFFAGCLLGTPSLSFLADSSLGRKKTLFLACFIMSCATLLTAASPNVWVYSFFRFLSGFGRASVTSCTLVLATETVGRRWRGHVGVASFLCFSIGFLSLPIIGYANRSSSWRLLYVWTSLPSIAYCVFLLLFVRESPRWLLLKGRREEAVAVMKHLSSSKRVMDMRFVQCVEVEKEANSVDMVSAVMMLVERRWARVRLLAVMVAATGLGLVYYGMPLAVGDLPVNLYVGVGMNALMEVPASLINLVLIGKMERKRGVMVLSAATAVGSVACGVMGNWSGGAGLVLGMELVAFFSGCTAVNVLVIYTVELFPTSVRNSALAMVREALVGACVGSPLVVASGRRNKMLSFGVFGVVAGSCSVFLAWLPETKGRALSDTLEEEEKLSNVEWIAD